MIHGSKAAAAEDTVNFKVLLVQLLLKHPLHPQDCDCHGCTRGVYVPPLLVYTGRRRRADRITRGIAPPNLPHILPLPRQRLLATPHSPAPTYSFTPGRAGHHL